MLYSSLALTLMASATGVQAGSLKDIKHIILFMQENRSFDHASFMIPLQHQNQQTNTVNCLVVLWHHGRRPQLCRPQCPGQ